MYVLNELEILLKVRVRFLSGGYECVKKFTCVTRELRETWQDCTLLVV